MKIFIDSIRQLSRCRKLIGLYWLVYLLFSIPLFMAVDHALKSNFASTGVSREWLVQFNTGYLLELMMNQPSFIWMTSRGVIATLLAFVLVSVLISAGTFGFVRSAINGSANGSLEDFFLAAGRYFGRFLRIGLWSLLLLILAAIPMAIGLVGLWVTLPLAALVLVNADMVRVKIVQQNSGQVTRMFFSMLGSVVRQSHVLALYYLPSIVLLLGGFLIYRYVDNSFEPNSIALVLIMVLVQQVFVVFRSAIRVQMISMATRVFDEFWPTTQPATVTLEEPKPEISSV